MMRLEDEYPMEPNVSGGIGAAVPGAMVAPTRVGEGATAVQDISNVDWKRVGRNDACPCGSGKKFKSCHYPQLREQGVI